MAIYAVGDIQGCLAPLKTLLAKVAFNPSVDTLWLVGDLVNRGPESLNTLRYLYALKDSLVTVLGNHDLHLLACHHDRAYLKRKDTLAEVLDAPDCNKLLDWLVQQPLMHHDTKTNVSLVHAGIAPMWTIQQALTYANEVHSVLVSPEDRRVFFDTMYGNQPAKWSDTLTGEKRWRVITNYFTRMRFCTADGELDFTAKEDISSAPEHFMPWFDVPNRAAQGESIIFGHWAALEGQCDAHGAEALDTGCVWGGAMTLYDVGRKEKIHCDCSEFNVINK